jgi:predicted RNA-binding protein with PIN domain
MSRNFLLIDAHNVIFARPDLSALHRRQPAAARDELIRILERHQDATGTRIVVVFDGGRTGGTSNNLSGPAGIQVIYPPAGQSADAVLERLVLKYADLHRLVVATNDHLIRTAAIAAGAGILDVQSLFDEIDRADAGLRSTLDRLRR